MGEPNDEHGTFEDKSAFASALMKGQTPTLMFHPESFFGERDVPLQAIFPIQFPYGIGGVKEKIPINVSEIECLKHYLRLSLTQFRRQDFLLVACHIYHRIRSFQTGYIRFQEIFQGKETLAERVSSFSEED